MKLRDSFKFHSLVYFGVSQHLIKRTTFVYPNSCVRLLIDYKSMRDNCFGNNIFESLSFFGHPLCHVVVLTGEVIAFCANILLLKALTLKNQMDESSSCQCCMTFI